MSKFKNQPKIKHGKHINQIRIIGGQLRGRKIQFPNMEGLRPTPDSVRERLFNWLGQDLTGRVVLDLFAGSGALGFESVSRCARQVILCDTSFGVVQNLRRHSQLFQIKDKIQIYQQDGLKYLAQTSLRFDVVFLDPPFAWQNWVELFELLKNNLNPNAYVYVEVSRVPEIPDDWMIVRDGKAGQSLQLLLQKQ
ncbi:16S rRNA (guanine(966)-N(2))-methyltransferase RsmD [Simonsiella muelleri]|uniref:RsmD family RNA methyltransferase n=1 Tax=Simonsiella muelleri ATCC 29453 TaxID=641147 RepID=V9HLR9_9NEIS|nr:16S rRNA (guanine(966)-N(2))-methyltransferase RsmD [Simonsiella muelleri]AUX62339.1 16S rRNA (guanine(966)-N(2))-methyltransferase RsmD [Simonsiella muelleri ATCC 29453]EFG30586.1 RsmD family RNA methyltransferase [Simonsiella muelleri ATCC 29453]UBQ52836.1 16S rRNA (guanine(966)-N(2))-methyltransferase RsmD [Simonsiella muelleri]